MDSSSIGVPAGMRIAQFMRPGDTFSVRTAQRIAEHLQVPLAYLFADSELLAQAILGFGLLTEQQQRKVVRQIKLLLFAADRQ